MSTKNAYAEKCKNLTDLLDRHNKALPKGAIRLDVKAIFNVILKEGGTNEAGLKSFSRQDFIDFGIPRALATQAVKMLEDVPSGEPAPAVKTKSSKGSGHSVMMLQTHADAVRSMNVFELVKGLDVNNPGVIGEELVDRAKRKARPNVPEDASRGRPFIFYTDPTGTKIARKASADYLQAILDGVPVTDTIMINGEPIAPVRVGDRPNTFLNENPLYPGRALRQPDDVCEVTNESYTGVSMDVRKLLSFAVKSGGLRIGGAEEARSIILAAQREDALAVIKRRYPKVAADFRDLPPEEQPSLRLKIGAAAGGGARPPFSS